MNGNVALSDMQAKIVNFPEGPICVKASAGSGKTRVLTERVRFLLNKSKRKVLALTFTNKAGREIKERLQDIPGLEKRTFIGTFHGFCQRMLENHGSAIGVSTMPTIFEDRNDRMELIRQALELTPSSVPRFKNGNSKNVAIQALDFISKIKRDRMGHSGKDVETQDLFMLYRNYQSILENQNGMDFDDLLILAHRLLINSRPVAELYRRMFFAICVDEAQDLNNAQYQFLVAFAGENFRNIMMVGDPNQSIFHFNGSSPNYMNKFFKKDFKAETVELNENYRSSKGIMDASEKIFPNLNPVGKTPIPGIFEMHCLEDEKSESGWIADKIRSLIKMKTHKDIEGDISYERIAVLARNRYVFKFMEESLDGLNIPSNHNSTSGGVKFESDSMQLFYLAIQIRLNKRDGLHKNKLLAMLGLDDNGGELPDIMLRVQDKNARFVLESASGVFDDGGNMKKILSGLKDGVFVDNDDEKNMFHRDVDEMSNHWLNYAKTTDSKSMLQFKNSIALGRTRSSTIGKGVSLSTVHSTKGREFDIVFLMGMDDGTFPDYRALEKEGELTQEKNNLYVAFTRARRFLYVTWPSERKMPWGDVKKRKISSLLECFKNGSG